MRNPVGGGSTRGGRVDQSRASGKLFGNSRVNFQHIRVSCEGGSAYSLLNANAKPGVLTDVKEVRSGETLTGVKSGRKGS